MPRRLFSEGECVSFPPGSWLNAGSVNFWFCYINRVHKAQRWSLGSLTLCSAGWSDLIETHMNFAFERTHSSKLIYCFPLLISRFFLRSLSREPLLCLVCDMTFLHFDFDPSFLCPPQQAGALCAASQPNGADGEDPGEEQEETPQDWWKH